MSGTVLNNVYEVLKTILPAIVTAIGTFFVTKYGYHKNIPLDKLEISYNRVYYPICHLIKNEEDIAKVVDECELYFKKYNKYVDHTTRMVFENLKSTYSLKRGYNKTAYNNFKDNIFSINARLRRRLGYLEPNILSLYKYAPPFEKLMLRVSIEGLLFYMSVLLEVLFREENISKILFVIIAVLFIVVVLECIISIIQLLWKGIKKVIQIFTKENKKCH